MAENDLSRFNDKQDAETLNKQNFTGKIIKNIKFSNISFIDCDFTGAQIRGCEFKAVHNPEEKSTFKRCIFTRCKFNGTKFFNVKFNEAIIQECIFENNIFNDVLIDSNSTFKDNEFIGEKFQVNNFMIRGQKIDDITKLTSVVETVQESVEEPFEEEYDDVENKNILNILFPEVLKQYDAFTKDEEGAWKVVIDGVEAAVCFDEETDCWRVLFSIINPSAEFGGDYIGGSELTCGLPARKITLDVLKNIFETVVKNSAEDIINKTNSIIVKNALKKIIQIVFDDKSVTIEATEKKMGSVIVETSANPESVTSFLTTGYDTENKTPVIIVGKPFVTENVAEANNIRAKITKAGFMINEDIAHLTTDELHKYAQENPYSCFVYEHVGMLDRVNIKSFGKSKNIILK